MKNNETNNIPATDLDDAGPAFDFTGLLHALLRKAWLIVLLALAAGLGTAAFVQRLPDEYRSTAVLQIEQQERRAIEVADNAQQDLRYPDMIETILQNFRNRSLMQRVAAVLHLASDPAFLGGTPEHPVPEDRVVAVLEGRARAELRPKTRLLDISFRHRDPLVARKVAQALVDEFLKQGVEQRLRAVETQNSVLQLKSEELKEKLAGSEKKLQEYKESMASVSLEDRRNLVDAKLTALNTDLSNAKGERVRLAADLQVLRDPGTQLASIPSLTSDADVIAVRTKVATQENEISSLTERYRDKHPRMIEARSQLASLREELDNALRSAPKRIEAALAGATAREQGLQTAVAEQERAALELDQKMIVSRALQREVESDRALCEAVLQKLKESALAMGIETVAFRVVEPAPVAQLDPNRRLLFLLAAVLGGAALGSGIIAAGFILDSSLKTVDDTERLLALPVLTAVPLAKRGGGLAADLPLIAKPDSVAAESFRTLRSAMSLLGPAEERKVFLIASAIPGEGKSFNAANLAIAFAQSGLNTLIIDADLRKPTLGALFGADPDTKGVAECLTGLTPAFFPTKVENLLLLPAGGRAPNPAELLASRRFPDLVQNMTEHFDRIVIDSAPLNVVSDTLNIVGCASTVCLVVRAGSTSRRLVQRAVELLRRAGVRPAGVVLNAMPAWNGVGYHYYYSSNEKYGGDDTYGGPREPHPAALARHPVAAMARTAVAGSAAQH